MFKSCCVECEKHKKKFGWEIELSNSIEEAMGSKKTKPKDATATIRLYQGTEIAYEIVCNDSRTWSLTVLGKGL